MQSSRDFKDHFSAQSERYLRHRPQYPDRLFAYLAELSPHRDRAWDCATGNGQAAVKLAEQFAEVVATDASAEQLDHAIPHPHVQYLRTRAEQSGLGEHSVDIVTVAQAVHWFQFDAFYAEVRRVTRPGGHLAVWCYELAQVSPAVDAVVERLYSEVLGDYWPPERRYIEERYATLPFPFREVAEPPSFVMQVEWTLAQLWAYIGTWSAMEAYKTAQGPEEIERMSEDLGRVWGPPSQPRRVVWPLHLRVGAVSAEVLST